MVAKALREWRAVATRYEKTASSFMGILCLAAALDWLNTKQVLDSNHLWTEGIWDLAACNPLGNTGVTEAACYGR